MRASNSRTPWSPESVQRYTRKRIGRASAGNRPTLRAFATWLESRGLGPGSVAVRLGSACQFVDAVTSKAGAPCAQAFRSLTPEGIEDFFVRYGEVHGMPARRSMRSAMRLFLKFAASLGWVRFELSDAVPSLRSYRLSNLPHHPSNEQLSILLRSPWGPSMCTRRNRAIVYLLVTYGVRREQVSALRLDDINWYEGTIDFPAHKRGKAIRHTLIPIVAESLADYLRNERPKSACIYVFLRQRRPYLRLGPAAITSVVMERMARCGLPPFGPHALRHSFATRLLQAGQPVKAIADLLGHRSLSSVGVYAKVDYTLLIEAAVDWPEVQP
jgi:integrase/recombinase XerD